jgi:predicted enzyme related to lactoylglutathione lyase
MFHGVSHICVPVRDLERSRRFYVEVVGCTAEAEGEDWIDLDAGGAKLRLIAVGPDTPAGPVMLRLLCGGITVALADIAAGGGRVISDAWRTPEKQVVGEAADPDGHRLVLWRDLTEDEYEEAPPLPADRTWSAEAEALLQRLLSSVPWPFRARARKSATAEAERLTDGPTVDIRSAVRGFIRSAPRPLRGMVRTPLTQNGFRAEDFADDFEA